jgi:hypothetical protein
VRRLPDIVQNLSSAGPLLHRSSESRKARKVQQTLIRVLLIHHSYLFYTKAMKYGLFIVILQTILQGFEALTIHLQQFP